MHEISTKSKQRKNGKPPKTNPLQNKESAYWKHWICIIYFNMDYYIQCGSLRFSYNSIPSNRTKYNTLFIYRHYFHAQSWNNIAENTGRVLNRIYNRYLFGSIAGILQDI